GSAGAIDIARARETARTAYAQVKLGRDPQGEKIKSRITAAETFAAAVDLYLAHQEREVRKSTYGNLRLSLITHAKPLHGLQLGKIERRDVARLLATITNNVGLTTANRTRAAISALYSWATTQDLTEHNPVMGTKPHAQKARDRVLTPPELVLVW